MNVSRFACRITLAALLPLLALASCAPPAARKDMVTPGIDKPARVVKADFDRLFPCLDGGFRTWDDRDDRDCVGGATVEPADSPAPPDRVEIYIALFDFAEDAVTRIRREIPPMYGQVMRYLFPHWPEANAWLSRSLEHTRESGCPRIAHVRDLWIIVRPGYNDAAQAYADVMITRSAGELAEWRKLDDPMCDGPPFVEEIRLPNA